MITDRRPVRTAFGLLLASALAGCHVPEEAGFPDVEALISSRTGQDIHWNRGSPEDQQAASAVRSLLGTELSVDGAIQVALLSNRRLQAEYEDLGVSQAELVQAGLLANPVFSAFVGLPATSEADPSWAFALVQDFLDLLMRPARIRLAAIQFEEAKSRVAHSVLEHAVETARAYYELVSGQQIQSIRQVVVEAAEAAYLLAKGMHEAGNMNDRDFAIERAAYEEARVAFARSQAEVLADREELTSLMGLWGAETAFRVPSRLPDLPAAEAPLERLESLAVEQRLDLAAARYEAHALEQALDTARTWRWIGAAELGVESEREPEEEDVIVVGPTATLELPIFDQRQARIARLEAEVRRAEATLAAMAIEIRSEVRAVRDRLLHHRDLAAHYRDVLVPLRERIVTETQLHYNFMLVGAFDLLLAKRDEVEAYREYVETVRDYWIARADLEHAVGGRLPSN